MNLSKNLLFSRSAGASAAGITEVNGAAVDMAGWGGGVFIVHIGAVVAGGVQSLSADQGSTSSPTDALKGSKVVIADNEDNNIFLLDIFRPTKQWLRPTINKATQNSTVEAILAIRYRGIAAPVTVDATLKNSKLLITPAEGAI